VQTDRPETPKQLPSTSRKPNNVASQPDPQGNNLGEICLDCGPLEADDTEPWRPAIDALKKIHRVPRAADLHPSLAFADKPWPSLTFGMVFDAVLELLRRSRSVFTAKGFKVDADPVNPLGDGKSWALVIEPQDNLPKGADPLELARQCQLECAQGTAEPMWNGQTILVPLWDSECEDAILSRAPQKRNTAFKTQSRGARSQRKWFVDPILREKGWSSLEWASESHVDWHTVNDYLSGKTRPYPSTLKKLAGSLGVKPEDLPE